MQHCLKVNLTFKKTIKMHSFWTWHLQNIGFAEQIVWTIRQYVILLNNNWLNCLESRNKHHITNLTKTCLQGMEYKKKIKFSPITLIYVLTNLFYFVNERPVPSHFFMILCLYVYWFSRSKHLFFVHYQWLPSRSFQLSRWIVFSISFISCLFYDDQRTPCFEQLPCRINKGYYFNDNILFN